MGTAWSWAQVADALNPAQMLRDIGEAIGGHLTDSQKQEVLDEGDAQLSFALGAGADPDVVAANIAAWHRDAAAVFAQSDAEADKKGALGGLDNLPDWVKTYAKWIAVAVVVVLVGPTLLGSLFRRSV
jgi:hypothetical protein